MSNDKERKDGGKVEKVKNTLRAVEPERVGYVECKGSERLGSGIIEPPSSHRLAMAGLVDTVRNSGTYTIIALIIFVVALIVFFVGTYNLLTLLDVADRPKVAGQIVNAGLELARLYTVGSTVPTTIVVICAIVVVICAVIAISWIVSLRAIIQEKEKRLAEMADEKSEQHKMFERIVGKIGIFQSSVSPPKEEPDPRCS